jgi:hypothetical protein
MARRLVLAAASLSALALLAAGCGGGNGGGGRTRDTTAWADDLCTAISAWQDSIADSVRSLHAAGLTRPALRDAATGAKKSTGVLVDELSRLGAPDAQAGAEAQDTVNELAADLHDEAADAAGAVDTSSTTAGAITSVTNTLVTMGNHVTSTLTQLGQLDAQGEIEHAFHQADACKTLVG